METNNQRYGNYTVFANHNYSFSYFHQKYKETCFEIAETMSLKKIRKLVSAFVYEFSYSIPSFKRWQDFKDRLAFINSEVDKDEEFNKVMEKESLTFNEEVKHFKTYYEHLLKYLELFSIYVSELTATYMPRTNLQQSLLKFRNDLPFYEKLMEFKAEVYSLISTFDLFEFRKRFNTFLTYYFAYKLFINEKNCSQIEKTLTYVLSIFVNEDNIRILARYPDYSLNDKRHISQVELVLQEGLLYCNSLINSSFSSYGIVPKLSPRVFSDRTLI